MTISYARKSSRYNPAPDVGADQAAKIVLETVQVVPAGRRGRRDDPAMSRRGDSTMGILVLTAIAAALFLVACQPAPESSAPEARPVRTVTVAKRDIGETVTYTGRIEAENETRLSFRIGGRMVERSANVGDRVEPGQVVARLEPQNELNALALRTGRRRRGPGAIQRGQSQLRASEISSGEGRRVARSVRAGGADAGDRSCPARFRRGAAEDRPGSGERYRVEGRCRRDRDRHRRRARRSGPGRAIDHSRGPERRAGRRVRCAGPSVEVGAERSARHGEPDRRSGRDDHRARPRGFPAGRSRHQDIRGQGRPDRSTRGHAARFDGHRTACNSTPPRPSRFPPPLSPNSIAGPRSGSSTRRA